MTPGDRDGALMVAALLMFAGITMSLAQLLSRADLAQVDALLDCALFADEEPCGEEP